MSAHVILNLLNQLWGKDKLIDLSSIFGDEINKFSDTEARLLDSIYHMTLM